MRLPHMENQVGLTPTITSSILCGDYSVKVGTSACEAERLGSIPNSHPQEYWKE